TPLRNPLPPRTEYDVPLGCFDRARFDRCRLTGPHPIDKVSRLNRLLRLDENRQHLSAIEAADSREPACSLRPARAPLRMLHLMPVSALRCPELWNYPVMQSYLTHLGPE